MAIFDMSHLTHIIEYMLTLLGFLVVMTRLRPQLAMFTVVCQTMLFFLQLLNIYLKENKGKGANPKLFLAEVMGHYLDTHPDGKKLAKETVIEDKVQEVCEEECLAGEPGTIG